MCSLFLGFKDFSSIRSRHLQKSCQINYIGLFLNGRKKILIASSFTAFVVLVSMLSMLAVLVEFWKKNILQFYKESSSNLRKVSLFLYCKTSFDIERGYVFESFIEISRFLRVQQTKYNAHSLWVVGAIIL